MKSSAFALSAFAAACILTGCSNVTVTTDFDKSAVFGKYKTYAVAPTVKAQRLSPSGEAALRDELRTELAARGMTEVKSGKPDLAIVPHVIVLDKVSVQQYTDWGYGPDGYWPYGYGHYHMWAGAPATYVDVSTYTEGTMVLDVVDTHTRKLVFRGTGTAVVGGPGENADKIREAVDKMVDALPK